MAILSEFRSHSGRHPGGVPVPRLLVRERQPAAPKPRLLDRVPEATRARHHSRRTARSHVAWIHRDVSTTMIYTHVLNRGPHALRSPADRMFSAGDPA